MTMAPIIEDNNYNHNNYSLPITSLPTIPNICHYQNESSMPPLPPIIAENNFNDHQEPIMLPPQIPSAANNHYQQQPIFSNQTVSSSASMQSIMDSGSVAPCFG